MISSFKRAFAIGLMGSVALPASAAWAAGEEDQVGGVGEIVVTAQRREQNLQDVPVAVTAISQNRSGTMVSRASWTSQAWRRTLPR